MVEPSNIFPCIIGISSSLEAFGTIFNKPYRLSLTPQTLLSFPPPLFLFFLLFFLLQNKIRPTQILPVLFNLLSEEIEISINRIRLICKIIDVFVESMSKQKHPIICLILKSSK
jgi:hypothetical protein